LLFGVARLVLAVATDGGSRLECRSAGAAYGPLRALCNGLAASPDEHISDQSFRSFRTPTGLSFSARQTLHAIGIQDAGSLPSRPPSALSGLAVRLLGNADDAGGTSALCRRHDPVHLDGDTI